MCRWKVEHTHNTFHFTHPSLDQLDCQTNGRWWAGVGEGEGGRGKGGRGGRGKRGRGKKGEEGEGGRGGGKRGGGGEMRRDEEKRKRIEIPIDHLQELLIES